MKTISAILALVLSLPQIVQADADDDAVAIQIAIAQVTLQPGGAAESPARDAPPAFQAQLDQCLASIAAGDEALRRARVKIQQMTPRVRIPADGELSPQGQWRWSTAQWAWHRVKPKAPAWPQYPTTPARGRQWRLNGGRITPEHLAASHHGRTFDYQWLKSQSPAQVCALGSDHHEEMMGRPSVRWQRVVRPTATPQQMKTYRTAPTRYVRGNCPGGYCPRR